MNSSNSSTDLPDYDDIQGIIINGYPHHTYSAHMIYQFGANSNPSLFIECIYPYVQPATRWTVRPNNMLNVGLTASGIQRLQPTLNVTKGNSPFPPEFVNGPASPGSQGSLFDLGPSAPNLWLFGNTNYSAPSGTPAFTPVPVDCLVHVYALSQSYLDELVTAVSTAAANNHITEVLPLNNGTARLEQYQLEPNFVHFGYHDGIDNPDLSTSIDLTLTVPPATTAQYTDPQNLNNFLIGYNNDVASYSTFIAPKPPATSPTPAAPTPEFLFAKNGCYNAFRMLKQDLQVFEDFLTTEAAKITPASDSPLDYNEYTKEWIAAKLVGRWRNGCPLELSPDWPDPKYADTTEFEYAADPYGLRCPISSHTRVTNPRDTTMISVDFPIPRSLRRGVPYGPPLGPDYGPDTDSGLVGLFLGGTLLKNFELLSFWMNNNTFTAELGAAFPTPQDPLVGNPQAVSPSCPYQIPTSMVTPATVPPSTNDISLPVAPAQAPLPQFIITRGSAYTLFPSMSALRSCF